MYLRELSKAEAPQDRLLDTTSFVAFTRDTREGSAKSANCIRVGDTSDLPNSPFWRDALCGVRNLGTGLGLSLHEFERFIVASALEIVRQARIDRAGQ